MKFRIMTNDVGPNAYSALTDIEAGDLRTAKEQARRKYGNLPVDPRRRDNTLRILVLPFDKFHLHNGRTGRIHPDAECYIVGHK